jgi:hypothetical protein
MISAVLELQGAVIAAIKASDGVANIVGNRIFDHVPRSSTGDVSARFPFVAWATDDAVTEDADCIDSQLVSFDIDCWSREPGFPEVRRLSAAVLAALHNAELGLTDNAIVLIRHDQTRTFRDPDGLTSHAVLTFEAVLEQN